MLVQGGAGAVGNAAIQLARWADATVIATVSSPEKAQLAAAAGADHVIDYRQQDVVAEVRKIAPKGVDAIVEVSAAVNAGIDAQVIGMHGSVAMYADDGGAEVTVPVRLQMGPNARWQFVLVYTEPARAKALAVEDVNAAVLDGAIRVGREAGLPLHVFPLARDRGGPPGGAGRRRRQGADRRHRLIGVGRTRSRGNRIARSSSSQSRVKTTDAATSVGQCIPR